MTSTKWFHRKEKNVIYCLWIEWQIFPFADKINKLPGKKKKRKYVRSENQQWTENTWDLKDIIRSVILGWRQRSAREIRWSLKRKGRSAGLSSEGREPLITQEDLSAPPCVFSGHRSTLQKGSPPQKKDMCELSLTVFLLHSKRRRRRIKV